MRLVQPYVLPQCTAPSRTESKSNKYDFSSETKASQDTDQEVDPEGGHFLPSNVANEPTHHYSGNH